MAAAEGGGVVGRCGEQESTAYNQDAGPGEATQRTPVQGNTDNRPRTGTSLVLACTRADQEREVLCTIVGVLIEKQGYGGGLPDYDYDGE